MLLKRYVYTFAAPPLNQSGSVKRCVPNPRGNIVKKVVEPYRPLRLPTQVGKRLCGSSIRAVSTGAVGPKLCEGRRAKPPALLPIHKPGIIFKIYIN